MLHHERFLAQANGPLPHPLPRIRFGPCPPYRQFSGCDYPNAIWLNRWDWLKRRPLYHELTHWVDMQYLSDADREVIRQRYGWPDVAWWWADTPERQGLEPNCERLAWLGVEMYLHPRKCRWLRSFLRERI